MSVNFDFIIVGGGSSGSALASILSQKGPTLLLERGANHTIYQPQSLVRQGWPQIAALTMEKYQSKDSNHWVGTPQILGGSSSLNAGACHRGQASLYQALGFDNKMVKDALQHLEDRLCMPGYSNSDYSKSFQNAWSNLGLNEDYQHNNNLQSGNRSIRLAKTIMPHPDSSSNNQLSGRRGASFLFEGRGEEGPTIMNQGNLTVYPLTTAKRVLFDKSKTAVGVEVHNPSGDFSLYVRQGGKIFLTSGAYETPKLLMLSGIGPRETLSQFDIPIIHANEMVGKNLMDRKSFAVGIPMLQNIKGDDIDMRDASAFFDDAWVSTTHKHAIDWGNALQGCAYMCPPDDRTQECATKITSVLMLYGGMKASSEPRHLAVNEIFQRRPSVRGHVTLESASYKDHPAVYDGWNSTFEHLSSDALNDLNSILNGVQNLVVDAIRDGGLLNNLGHSLSSDNLEGSFTDELIDILAYYMMSSVTMTADLTIPCKSDTSSNLLCTTWENCVPTVPQLPNDLDDLSKVVFEGLTSSYDASGTCKVGDVVDYRTLRVQGVHSLYISDLSVLTEPVDVDPMVTAMSIGMLMGNVTEGIPSESYEILPVIFSIFCIAIVFVFFSIWVFSFFISRRRATKTHTPVSNGRSVPDEQEEFELLTEDNKNTLLVWKDVSCSYIKGRNKSNPPVKTLRSSSGALKEGEITAVMGPSGSCKSTLLDILAGRKSVGDVSGKFSILGHDLDAVSDGLSGLSHGIKGCSAYIPQQEFFYPTQTLEEAVAFIINMKFGKGDPHERKRLIHEYLTKVGLEAESYASRTIGGDLGGGIVIRGLSGGERKRLALACTLALKPRILFIDELTSGLDSENTLMIMKLLKALSVKEHVASMVIIHQPDPDTFALFDRLVLLSKGRTVFSGPCHNLGTFYETNYGELQPVDYKIATDLILKASSFDTTMIYPFKGEVKEIDFETSQHQEEIDLALPLNVEDEPGLPWKLFIVFQRNLMNQYVRNIANVGARLGSYSALSVITGAIFWKVGRTESTRGLTFEEASLVVRSSIFIINISYLLPFATIPVFITDKKFFAAETALGLYSSWMYAASQLILESAFLTVISIIETGIVVPMCGLWNPTFPLWICFFTVLSILLMAGLVGSTMVLCCAMWLPSQDLTFLVSSTIVTIALALSGGFLAFADMPALPYAIQWISPVKYSYQALLISQLKGTSAEKVLDISGYDSPPTIMGNIGALCVFFVGIAGLTVIAMTRVKEIR